MGVGLLGSVVKGAMSPLTAGLNIMGGNDVASALKDANSQARTDLNTGYDKATGFQQPIYDKALGAYTNLNDKYNAGGFSNPHMDPYKFDPNQVFQDPEYQAQMKAGTQALDSSAQSKGMLFSGPAQRDLMKFGQDTFAGRSDALYKRGFDATNKAFDQNNTTNLNNFDMGKSLASPLTGAASNLSNLSTERGSDLASLDQERGMIRAGNIGNTYSSLTGGLNELGDSTIGAIPGMQDYLAARGGPKMTSLTGSMFTPRSALS